MLRTIISQRSRLMGLADETHKLAAPRVKETVALEVSNSDLKAWIFASPRYPTLTRSHQYILSSVECLIQCVSVASNLLHASPELLTAASTLRSRSMAFASSWMRAELLRVFCKLVKIASTFCRSLLIAATAGGASLILLIKSCSFLRLCKATAVMLTMLAAVLR